MEEEEREQKEREGYGRRGKREGGVGGGEQ